MDLCPKLTFLTYGCYCEASVLPCAIRQLEAVTPRCNLIRIFLDLSVNQLDLVQIKALDSVLTGGKFPLLETVILRKTLSPDLFPNLRTAGRLGVLGASFWMDPPHEEELNSRGDHDRIEDVM